MKITFLMTDQYLLLRMTTAMAKRKLSRSKYSFPSVKLQRKEELGVPMGLLSTQTFLKREAGHQLSPLCHSSAKKTCFGFHQELSVSPNQRKRQTIPLKHSFLKVITTLV